MRTLSVRAREVRLDDDLFNNKASQVPAFQWARVIGIEYALNSKAVRITTMAWITMKHPDEAITVRRGRPSQRKRATKRSS